MNMKLCKKIFKINKKILKILKKKGAFAQLYYMIRNDSLECGFMFQGEYLFIENIYIVFLLDMT